MGGSAGAAARHLEETVGVDPRALDHAHGLGERRRVHRAHGVGQQLGHLAVTARADVHDELAHRLEQRQRALEVGALAAGHDRERAVLGLGPRAGDGRLQEAPGRARASASPIARRRWGRSWTCRAQRARRERLGRSLVAEQHRLDLGRVGTIVITRPRPRPPPRACRRPGAVLGGEALGLLLGVGPHRQLEAGARQVGRHRPAHDAQPAEGDALSLLHVHHLRASRFAAGRRARACPRASPAAPRRSAGSYQARRARRRPRPAGRGGGAR